MDLLNNRELATLIWMFLLLIWSLTHADLRDSLANVLKHAFASSLMKTYVAMLGYIAGMLILLSSVGLWDTCQLKATILWTLAIGFISLFRAADIHKDPGYFNKSVRDNINLIVVLEFIMGVYSFSLLSELIMLPILALLTMVMVFSENKPEFESVHKLLQGLFVVFGVFVLSYALYKIVTGFEQFATLKTLTDFYMPPLLSILFLPFPYGLSVFMAYERGFQALKRNSENDEVFTYAKKVALLKFGLKVHVMERWVDRSYYKQLTSKELVDQSVAELNDLLAIESNPPEIDPALGWSPYSAKDFLAEYDLKTGHYKSLDDEEWFCSAPLVDIDEGLFPNALAYYLSGDKAAVKSLKLRLYVNTPELKDEAIEYFANISEVLLSEALNVAVETNLYELIVAEQDAQTTINGKRVSIKREDWKNRQSGGFDLTFEVSV